MLRQHTKARSTATAVSSAVASTTTRVPHATAARSVSNHAAATPSTSAATISTSTGAILPKRKRAQDRISTIDARNSTLADNFRYHLRPTRPAENTHTTASAITPPTLYDTFNRKHTYLRLSLTEKCSFRCVYCMPKEGVPLTPDGHLLTTDEVKKIAKAFVQMGVTKVRLTGGEPLLRKDIVEIVRYLRHDLGVQEIGLTTNALVLARVLDPLVEAGLTHLNISIDSLKPDRFASLSRMSPNTLQKVLRTIDLSLAKRHAQLQQQHPSPLKVKLNVVVIKGNNQDEAVDFVRFTKDRDIDVRFIEYMPFLSNSWSTSSLLPSADLLAAIQQQYPAAVNRSIDSSNDTTRHYSVSGFKGRFGFISSMTDHFCGTCNRVRVLADGAMKVCLFGSGKGEVSLRDALRRQESTSTEHEEEHLKGLISSALNRKHFKHAGMPDPKAIWQAAESSDSTTQGREMSRIGG
ncbi:unnamed protein product [Sympodiomycopsis kandeliae]